MTKMKHTRHDGTGMMMKYLEKNLNSARQSEVQRDGENKIQIEMENWINENRLIPKYIELIDTCTMMLYLANFTQSRFYAIFITH